MNFADSDPERAVQIIEDTVSEYLRSGKKLVFLGGEHSVTVGVVRAFAQKDSNLSVLHLDAHADLRESYQRSRFNHACVTARLLESCPVVSVGIRSMSVEEFKRIQGEELSVYTVQKIRKQDWWMEAAVSHLTDRVYITIDLDVFDPYIVPGVGTPEPGGMRWEEVLAFLRLVFKQKQGGGFDVVELSPRAESDRSAFIAAKLIYRLIGYWTVEG